MGVWRGGWIKGERLREIARWRDRETGKGVVDGGPMDR